VSFAGYPLVVEPHVVGVVAMFSREPFPEEVLQELSLIAGGLAQWIHRVRVEEQFRKGAGRLQLALKAGKLGDWSWDAKTDVVMLGTRAAEIFGLPPDVSITWAKLREILHMDDRERARVAVEVALSSRSDYDIEYRVEGPSFSGEHWVAARGQGIYTDDGTILGMTGVVQDVTEQKRASEVLEGMVQERTAKLKETIAELEAFSYSISHDMRSPLRAMQGYADALLEKYQRQLDETGARYLERIQRGALRLDLLIQDVLAYSKVAKGEVALKEVDLDVIIRDVIQNYPHIDAHGCQPLPKVVGHEAYLTQIISNLLGNAVKFVSPGTQPEVRVWTEIEGPTVRVWIEDNGIGIDPSHHGDIFQIFGRVYSDKKYEGTGIGLAIVKKAAERLGGSVGVMSELTKGSRFWLTLRRSL
jgi:PAS domain S-box-containing protein